METCCQKSEQSPRSSRVLTAPFIVLIRAYQWLISPLLGPRCRFHPTCSEYAAQALGAHGFWRGCALALTRIAKCHPWHHGGYDPVPAKQESTTDRSE